MRIAILAIYIGELPALFPIWLSSCSRNSFAHWYIITDKPIRELPSNCTNIILRLEDLRRLLSAATGESIVLDGAYKLCDYRPTYGLLIQELGISCDYWGHCDFDMIFGDLEKFIAPSIELGIDKIFSFGHLSLYKNSARVNSAFREPGAPLAWPDVFRTPRNLGFDEEYGINRIFVKNGLSIHPSDTIIADVLPGFDRIVINNVLSNMPGQFILYENGKVFLGRHKTKARPTLREYAYVHLQKRRLEHIPSTFGRESGVLISSKAVHLLETGQSLEDSLKALPTSNMTIKELSMLLNLYRRRLFGAGIKVPGN